MPMDVSDKLINLDSLETAKKQGIGYGKNIFE